MQGIPLSSIRPQRSTAGGRRYRRYLRRRRLRLYLHPLFRSSHPTLKRFIVLSQMRVGSNLLRSLINSHPQVFCQDELFKRLKAFNARLLLENAAAARPEPVFGYMLKPHHPEDEQGFDNGEWIRWMQEEGFRLIHLRREDALRHALSIYMAMGRNVWIKRDGAPPRLESVTVDIERLLQIRAFVESWRDVESLWLESMPARSFSYERDLQDAGRHQSTADAVFEFLEVESVPVQTDLVRTLPTDPAEFVLNWDEVLEAST